MDHSEELSEEQIAKIKVHSGGSAGDFEEQILSRMTREATHYIIFWQRMWVICIYLLRNLMQLSQRVTG